MKWLTSASMRTTILISAALIAVWLAYAASPFFAVYDLLRVVQERNLAELPARVDFPAVRRSLTAQIVRTYLRITGKTGQSGSIVEQFAVSVGASLADPMVAKLVSPETFLDLLRDGKPSNVLSEDAPSVGGLSSEALKNLWRVYANSELGIARFFLDVPVDKPPQDSFRLQFCLKDWTWRLCGVELPEPLQLRLAQEVMNSEGR
jgi:Protein of unknown function (DUF2939)